MKKFLIVFMILMSASMLFANPLEYIESGAYAYYVDNRGGSHYARGYLICHIEDGSSVVFMNTINRDNGESYRSVASITETENKELNLEKLQVGDFPEEEKNQVMQTYIDLLNFDSMYRNFKNKIDYDCVLEDSWQDYSLYYHFSKVFPMFKFSQISFNDSKLENVVYYTLKFGIYQSVNNDFINDFYNYQVSITQPVVSEKKINIPKKTKIKVKMSGYSFNLDQNWTLNEFEDKESWWLQVSSIRDAQLMVEPLPVEMKLDTLERKNTIAERMINSFPNLIPESLKVWQQNKDLFMSYDVYDEENDNEATITILCFKDDALINFSSFKNVYLQNEKYFNTILGIK